MILRNSLTSLMAALCAFALTPASFAQQPDAAGNQTTATSPVGFYRLVGVMETASQLQLEADGTYKWMLIVGGLDLYSEGKWTETNGTMVLGPHEFDRDAPVFTLGDSYAWGREETDAAYRMAHIRLKNRAKWKCAFLEKGGYFSSVGDLVFPKDLPPKQQFEAAVKIEREMRMIYEGAIAAYFERDMTDDDDNLEITARTARQKWEHAVAFLAQSGRAADRNGQYQPPSLPAECLFLSDYTPDHSRSDGNANVNWNNGVGIWINRRERPNPRLKVDAEFSFTDGSVDTADSYELGFAFVPVGDERKLQSIKLTLRHDARKYSSIFDVPQDKAKHVYEVKLDNRVFIKPPFEELRLKVAGDRLMPTDGSKGYYIKRK